MTEKSEVGLSPAAKQHQEKQRATDESIRGQKRLLIETSEVIRVPAFDARKEVERLKLWRTSLPTYTNPDVGCGEKYYNLTNKKAEKSVGVRTLTTVNVDGYFDKTVEQPTLVMGEKEVKLVIYTNMSCLEETIQSAMRHVFTLYNTIGRDTNFTGVETDNNIFLWYDNLVIRTRELFDHIQAEQNRPGFTYNKRNYEAELFRAAPLDDLLTRILTLFEMILGPFEGFFAQVALFDATKDVLRYQRQDAGASKEELEAEFKKDYTVHHPRESTEEKEDKKKVWI